MANDMKTSKTKVLQLPPAINVNLGWGQEVRGLERI